VSYRAQLCDQTQEWLTDRGTPTCVSRKSPPPLRTLAWLGGKGKGKGKGKVGVLNKQHTCGHLGLLGVEF